MTDTVHADRQARPFTAGAIVEPRLMFGLLYALFLFRAVIARLMPWRRRAGFGGPISRESIFSEASNAASVLVASSFMGL